MSRSARVLRESKTSEEHTVTAIPNASHQSKLNRCLYWTQSKVLLHLVVVYLAFSISIPASFASLKTRLCCCCCVSLFYSDSKLFSYVHLLFFSSSKLELLFSLLFFPPLLCIPAALMRFHLAYHGGFLLLSPFENTFTLCIILFKRVVYFNLYICAQTCDLR